MRCESSTKCDTKVTNLNFKECGRNSWSCHNLVGVLSYGANGRGFESLQGPMLVFFKASRLFLGPTYPFIQWVLRGGGCCYSGRDSVGA